MLEQIKIIGKRRPTTDFEQVSAFLDTVVALRGDQPFVPKGFYRFKTFEEAQACSIRMMARGGRQPTEKMDVGHRTSPSRK